MSEARHNPVLAGQTAVITGGASGIGKSIVQRFLEAGASCLAADLNEEALAALKQELAEYGDKLDVVKVDVSNRETWRAWSTAPSRRSADGHHREQRRHHGQPASHR